MAWLTTCDDTNKVTTGYAAWRAPVISSIGGTTGYLLHVVEEFEYRGITESTATTYVDNNQPGDANNIVSCKAQRMNDADGWKVVVETETITPIEPA